MGMKTYKTQARKITTHIMQKGPACLKCQPWCLPLLVEHAGALTLNIRNSTLEPEQAV